MTTDPSAAREPDHPSMADLEATLPTGRLLLTGVLASALAGGAWFGVMLSLGQGTTIALTGLAGAAAVVVGVAVSLLAIRPWRPRTLMQWPIVWVGGSFIRLLVTLGAAFLLYSATPFRSRMLWFAVVIAYIATQVGETRVYSISMRRFAPGRLDAPPLQRAEKATGNPDERADEKAVEDTNTECE